MTISKKSQYTLAVDNLMDVVPGFAELAHEIVTYLENTDLSHGVRFSVHMSMEQEVVPPTPDLSSKAKKEICQQAAKDRTNDINKQHYTVPFEDKKTAEKYALNLAQCGKAGGVKVVEASAIEESDEDARCEKNMEDVKNDRALNWCAHNQQVDVAILDQLDEVRGHLTNHDKLIRVLLDNVGILQAIVGLIKPEDMTDEQLHAAVLSKDADFCPSSVALNKETAKRKSDKLDKAAQAFEVEMAKDRAARLEKKAQGVPLTEEEERMERAVEQFPLKRSRSY